MYFDAVKLPYRGVLIERPCSSCDTVDMHYEAKCAQGPCTQCSEPRSVHYKIGADGHDWQPNVYQPALINQAPASFDALIDQAREIGMPAHFTSDLFRDYQLLTNQGLYRTSSVVRRFIWCVRSTGTDVLTEAPTPSTANLLLERNERIFEWNGVLLRETDRDTAKCLLSAYRIGKTQVPA